MPFASLSFAVLVAAAVALHWALPWQRARLAVLLVASAIFYGWAWWPSLLFLAASFAFNWPYGLLLEKRREPARARRLLLGLGIAANLAPLLWFKYAAFLAEAVVLAPLRALGLAAAAGVPEASGWVPLGLSFSTFQVLAWLVDVGRGKLPAERSWLRFAVFRCLFANITAGPIVRAGELLPQLAQRRAFDARGFHHGLFLLVAGLALKVGVADVLAQYARQAFSSVAASSSAPALTTSGAWTGLYAYAFQIYADFWGYSIMAIGVGLLFGLELPVNFRSPYLAPCLQQFWRRWHITLSDWLRDYLFFPLGGALRRPVRNFLITMGIAGLWHGAGWGFLAWGLALGGWLSAELLLWGKLKKVPRALKVALTFHGVCLAWVLFRSPDLAAAGRMFARLLLPPYSFEAPPSILPIWLVGFALLQVPLARAVEQRRFVGLRLGWQVAVVVTLSLFCLAHAGAQIDFIYQQF